MQTLVGREAEKSLLLEKWRSEKSEFIAVYGRRRIGKTFLIRSLFEGRFSFQLTGIGNATLSQQLINFNLCLKNAGSTIEDAPATNWIMAFAQLGEMLAKSSQQRKIVFLDELPWLDTPKSGFLQALEHFWNSWASARNDIILIVCGSAASWMIHKLINNKGGLHNRITLRLKIQPFTLRECALLQQKKNGLTDHYQLIQLYMVLGGVPFYWEQVSAGRSAAQNIDAICFAENGLLRTEFKNLFSSLFSGWEKHEAIIEALASKAMGLTRDEILKTANIQNAGSATRVLNELEESGFIKKYSPFGKKTRTSLYQLVDAYSLFYIRFIKDKSFSGPDYWLNMLDNPAQRAWSGYAFEQVCLYHIEQIKKALGIAGILTNISSWRSHDKNQGAQIDLVIDRRDQVINLFEMKFSIGPFSIDKRYAEELRQKLMVFKTNTSTRKSLFLSFITSFGLAPNNYSIGLVQNDFSMDILFDS